MPLRREAITWDFDATNDFNLAEELRTYGPYDLNLTLSWRLRGLVPSQAVICYGMQQAETSLEDQKLEYNGFSKMRQTHLSLSTRLSSLHASESRP